MSHLASTCSLSFMLWGKRNWSSLCPVAEQLSKFSFDTFRSLMPYDLSVSSADISSLSPCCSWSGHICGKLKGCSLDSSPCWESQHSETLLQMFPIRVQFIWMVFFLRCHSVEGFLLQRIWQWIIWMATKMRLTWNNDDLMSPLSLYLIQISLGLLRTTLCDALLQSPPE